VGNAADLVFFDPDTIADPATFDDPRQYPEGIETVVVNGVGVIDHGHTGALPGRSPRGGATGDGIGNGRAAAILLARAGANVLVVDRDLALAEATVEMITSEGGKAIAAAYDVTSSAQCSAMVADAVSRWGRLDCLDNNMGIGSTGTVVEESVENWTA
jgi:hypothetical protein